eukprot:145839-Chlamydomonas_euryale.AAC.1
MQGSPHPFQQGSAVDDANCPPASPGRCHPDSARATCLRCPAPVAGAVQLSYHADAPLRVGNASISLLTKFANAQPPDP